MPEPEPVAISVPLLEDEPVGEETPPVHLVDIVLGLSLLPYATVLLSLNL